MALSNVFVPFRIQTLLLIENETIVQHYYTLKALNGIRISSVVFYNAY